MNLKKTLDVNYVISLLIKNWENFNAAAYAINVGNELLWALEGLVEE